MFSKPSKVKSEDVIAAEERFLFDVQHSMQWLLNDCGMSRSELADAIGVSEPRVSQMFGHRGANLTLRTVGRIFHILGEECEVTSPRLEELKAETRRKWTPAAQAEEIALDEDAFVAMIKAVLEQNSAGGRSFANDNSADQSRAADHIERQLVA